MANPVINPDFLTQKQREEIKRLYDFYETNKKSMEDMSKHEQKVYQDVAPRTIYTLGLNQGALSALIHIFGKSILEK